MNHKVEVLAYTVAEASRAMSVPETTIRWWIQTKRLPMLKFGHRVFIEPEALQRLIGMSR